MLLRVTLCFFLCLPFTAAEETNDDLLYFFPEPLVEAFEPRGLRVSIPDSKGIELFAFHGNINKELNQIDAGDLSKDIVRKTGNRWVYENKNIKLRLKDKVNFWLFVIRNHLGYKLDNQSFVIETLSSPPDGFIRPPPKRPGYTPQQTTPKSTRTSTTKPVLPVQRPDCPSCHCPHSSTTLPPPLSTTETIHTIVNIWAESLNNATEEKIQLIQQIKELEALNEQLMKKIEFLGAGSDRRLLMSGRIPQTLDAESFVLSVLREKLLVKDKVLNVERNDDNTITFEMEDMDGKINVLRVAKDRLANSKIVISDFTEKSGGYDKAQR